MNQQQIGTKLALDAMGIQLSMGTFDERLIVQKAVYLAKAAGHDCGHFFRWYLRGPYSTELTQDAFSMAGEIAAGEDEWNDWKLDDEMARRLDSIGRLIPRDNMHETAQKLELLASVHFLVDRRQVSDASADSIVDLLHKYNKPFSKSDVEAALKELRANDLLPK